MLQQLPNYASDLLISRKKAHMEDRLKWLLKEEGVYFSRVMIGASVSEPHSSESNWDFSYIIIYIYFLAYIVPYLLNAVI